jgi:hypothetical protein
MYRAPQRRTVGFFLPSNSWLLPKGVGLSMSFGATQHAD